MIRRLTVRALVGICFALDAERAACMLAWMAGVDTTGEVEAALLRRGDRRVF